MADALVAGSQIGFTDLVRIKSILVGTGGGQLPSSPRRVKVWVNRQDGVAFDEVEDLKAEQEFALLEGSGTRGAVEYPVRMSKFGNVSSIDLFFVSHYVVGNCLVSYAFANSPTCHNAVSLLVTTTASGARHPAHGPHSPRPLTP